jgi:DNA-binding phage protein
MPKITHFEPYDYISNEAMAQAYLDQARQTGDARLLESALQDVTAAREKWADAAVAKPVKPSDSSRANL